MNTKSSLALAGAVALAIGAAPLAMAQYPSTATTPAQMGTQTSATSATSSMTSGHATGMRNMHQGNNVNMSKSAIRKIQKALRGDGYYVQVDGIWGRSTTDAIKSLQFKNGLKVTGRPDANTKRALGMMESNNNQSMGMHNRNSRSNMNNGMRNNSRNNMNNRNGMQNNMQQGSNNLSDQQISHLKRALDRRGYHVNQNDKWDSRTRSALKRFQRQNNLQVTGRPDRPTRKALDITDSQWQSWGKSHMMSPSSETSMSPSARTY